MFIIILSLILCVGWYFHKARQAGVSLLIQIISAFVGGVFAVITYMVLHVFVEFLTDRSGFLQGILAALPSDLVFLMIFNIFPTVVIVMLVAIGLPFGKLKRDD